MNDCLPASFQHVFNRSFSVVGFLSQLAQGKSMDDCVRCGHYAANYMIQQSGVTLLDSPKFS